MTRVAAPARRAGSADRDLPGRWTLVRRSLPLQAAFNPVTLQGAGFAAALLPELERAHGAGAGPRAATLASGFNANPYLATFALGAVSAAEGLEPAARIDRFLRLVRGPLGSLGDTLFWSAARPALLLPAALVVTLGGPWWIALVALASFNLLAFGARLAGARAGLARGLDVAEELARSWIRTAPAGIRSAGACLIGLAAGAVVAVAAAGGRTGGWTATTALQGEGPGWIPAAVFALALPLFALWPRRLGWGVALLAAWALVVRWGAA